MAQFAINRIGSRKTTERAKVDEFFAGEVRQEQ
jgi:hypothetical protein